MGNGKADLSGFILSRIWCYSATDLRDIHTMEIIDWEFCTHINRGREVDVQILLARDKTASAVVELGCTSLYGTI